MSDPLNTETEENHDSLNEDKNIESPDEKKSAVSLEQMTDSAIHLLSRYQQLGSQALEVAKIEAKLSIKSLFYTFILMTCFAGCLVVGWIALNTMLGFWLFSIGLSLWLIIPGLFSLQIILLIALWKGIKHLISNIGFSNTLKASSKKLT